MDTPSTTTTSGQLFGDHDYFAVVENDQHSVNERQRATRTTIEKARQCVDKREYQEAERLLSEAVRLEPANYDALSNMARVLILTRRFSDAINYLDRAREIRPKALYPWIELSKCHLETGEVDRAYDAAKQAIELDPNSTVAHSRLGMALLNKKQLFEAKTEFENVLSANPSNPSCQVALGGLAKVFLEQGKLSEAAATCNKLMEVAPENWLAHSYLGYIYAARREFEAAAAEFELVLELHPDDMESLKSTACMNALTKQHKRAIVLFERYLSKAPGDTQAMCSLAENYFIDRQPKKAIETLRSAVALDPHNRYAHKQLAKALFFTGSWGAALWSFLRYVAGM